MKVKNKFLIMDILALLSIIILRGITKILSNDILYGTMVGTLCLLIVLTYFDLIRYKGDIIE